MSSSLATSTLLLSGYKALLVQWLRKQGASSQAFECEFFSWTYSPHLSLASAVIGIFNSRDACRDGIEIHTRFVPDMETPKATLQGCEIANRLLAHAYGMDSRVTFHVFPGREKLLPIKSKRPFQASLWGSDGDVEVILLETNAGFLLHFLQGLLQADWPGAKKTKTLKLDCSQGVVVGSFSSQFAVLNPASGQKR